MVKIKQQLVLQHIINKRTSGPGNPCNFITIHETGNEGMGAGAQSHADLQSRLNPREASWHFQVDDEKVIQSFLENIRCWHAGDGNGKGNMESIGIEICVNRDSNYKKAVQNAAELTRHLMEKYDIPIANVKQHYDWSEKDCPKNLRKGTKGYTWDGFKGLIRSKPTDNTYVLNKDVSGHVNAVDAKAGHNKKTTVKAGVYYIYKEHDGMLNLTRKEGVPGSWVNPSNNKVEQKPTPAPKTFLIRVKASELWYYDKPDWNAKKDTVKRGDVFTVVDTLHVNGSKMYKLKSGTYITANTKYVEIYKK